MALIRWAAAASLVVLPQLSVAAERTPRLDLRGVPPSSFYVGAHGGVGWAKDKLEQYDSKAVYAEQTLGSDPAFGGLHVGFKREVDGVLVGVEADYDFGGSKKSTAIDYPSSSDPTKAGVLQRGYEYDGRATLRARLGYTLGVLSVYATGGGALANIKMSGSAVPAQTNTTYTGPVTGQAFGFGATVGGGFEYAITRNWSAFTEYRYADFGKVTLASDNGMLTSKSQAAHRITETSVRAGATYYFR